MSAIFKKMMALLVDTSKSASGFLPSGEKKVLAKAVKSGAVTKPELDKLMIVSKKLKKQAKIDSVGSDKPRFKANQRATEPLGTSPTAEVNSSRGLSADSLGSVKEMEAEETAKTVIAKTRKPRSKARRLKADKAIEASAKKGYDVGDKFLANKKAQISLVNKRMKSNEKLSMAVTKAGGALKFVNSTTGQKWIKRAIARKK